MLTTNVNTGCCRDNDGVAIGDWYYPNGSVIPRSKNILDITTSFVRYAYYTHQVCLAKNGTREGPIGLYRCEVPDKNVMIV